MELNIDLAIFLPVSRISKLFLSTKGVVKTDWPNGIIGCMPSVER